MSFSPLFVVNCEWVIKLTAYKFKDGSSKTEYLSNRYWKAGELYSSSPEIYPMLADPPATLETMGRVFREATDQTVTLFGKSSFKENGVSFFDEFADYELENAKFEFYIYEKPLGALASTTDTLHMVGRGRGYSWNGDILQLSVRCSMLTEKEFAQSYTEAELTEIEDSWIEQPFPIVFGAGASGVGTIVDAAKIYGTSTSKYLLLSNRFNGHNLGDVKSFFIQDRLSLTGKDWVKGNLDISSGIASSMIYSDASAGGFARSIRTYEIGLIVDQPSDFIIKRAVIELYPPGGSNPPAGDGDVEMFIYLVQSEDWANNKLVLGDLLESFKIGSNFLTTTISVDVQAFTNIGLAAGKYFITCRLSNTAATVDICTRNLASVATKHRHWRRDRATNPDAAFVTATESLAFEVEAIVTSDLTVTNTNVGSKYYARVAPFTTHSLYTPTAQYNPSAYKVGLEGIKDDTSGTYTGVASSVIKRPCDIIRFLLGHASFLGISSGEIDATSFGNCRTEHQANSYFMSFATDGRFKIVDLIAKILEQSDTVLYRNREDKIFIKYLSYADSNKKNAYQSYEQDEMRLVTEFETEAADVINDLLIYYANDDVNRVASRRGNYLTQQLEKAYEINATSSTDKDSYRQDLASDSQTVYGNLPLRASYDLYPSDSLAVPVVSKRLFDRHYRKRRKQQIRLPLKRWLSASFFDTVFLSLNLLTGTGDREIFSFDSGTEVKWYRSGLPFKLIKRGSSRGEIKQIEKTDQSVIFTIEETLPF